MSFMVEVVVYLGVITGKFLKHCTTFKLLYRSFSSSKWPVRIFASVVGVLSDECELVSARTMKPPVMPHRVDATQQERRFG